MKRIITTLTLTITLFFTVTACEPPVTPLVAIYGDSLTYVALSQLPSGWGLHAKPGTTLLNWKSLIDTNQSPTVILALGTNDAHSSDPITTWTQVLDELSGVCVIWPKTFRSSIGVVVFDNNMATLVANYPNVRVVDWDATVQQHREWLLSDGVHYTPEGVNAYATMLNQSANLCN